MKAEILSIGTEILLGEIVDTNAAFIASRLPALGVDIYFKAVVGDNLDRLTETIGRARERSDIVICTGGLGPTEDDLTREAISAVLGETPARRPGAGGRPARVLRAPRLRHAGAERQAVLGHPLGARHPEPARHRARLVGRARRQDHHRHARPADRDDPHVGEGGRAGAGAPQPRHDPHHAHAQDRRHRRGHGRRDGERPAQVDEPEHRRLRARRRRPPPPRGEGARTRRRRGGSSSPSKPRSATSSAPPSGAPTTTRSRASSAT